MNQLKGGTFCKDGLESRNQLANENEGKCSCACDLDPNVDYYSQEGLHGQAAYLKYDAWDFDYGEEDGTPY
jgi:hypothetical protein